MQHSKINSQEILKGIGAGLYLLDKNLCLLWANRIISDWFSFKDRDLCRKHCYRIFRHREHFCRGCLVRKVFSRGRTYKLVRTYITKEGQKRYFQLIVSPIKENGKVTYALGFLQDVSKEVKKERDKLKIINRLKHMYKTLLVAKKRLQQDTERLKTINKDTEVIKTALEKKYRKKIREIFDLKEEVKDLIKISQSISVSSDLKKICSQVARFTCEIVHTQACAVRLIDKKRESLVLEGGRGLSKRFLSSTPLKIGEGISGHVAKTHKSIAIYDIGSHPWVKYSQIAKEESICSALSVPIIFKGKILGVISTYSKIPRHFREEEIRLLSAFASQVAIAIQESRHYEEIHATYFNTIHSLVLAVEARDPYTRGHTERVTKYALEVARALQVPHRELEVLRYAGEVHDVGKINTPDFILNKPGPLTPAERATVELHPVKGVEMLEPLEFLRPALPIVRHHHEKYDGRGYPDGLKEEKIPLMSRILACADAFDAMTSERPYRKRKLTIEEALEEIKKNAGSQFDPHIASLFIKVIRVQNLT